MTFAFGMSESKTVYRKKDAVLRVALMEEEGTRDKEAQIEAIRKIQALPNVVIAIGNRILLNGFDRWLGRSTASETRNVIGFTQVHAGRSALRQPGRRDGLGELQ